MTLAAGRNPMELETSPLPGVFSFVPDLIEDGRGFFYESYSPRLLEALGSCPSFLQENVSRSRRAGVRLMLEGGHESTGKREQFCVYFRVSGIEAAAATLRTRQVYFEREPHRVAKMPDHELWMAFMHDPDGNLLALMEEKR